MTKIEAIRKGQICPYCGQESQYVDSEIVYGDRSYGMIYLCAPCAAYVGVHKGTDRALGRLANSELRAWKQKAHRQFDWLWKMKMKKGFTKKESRLAAYKWLSEQMGLPIHLTHIGMMDVDQCKQVVDICKNWRERHKYPSR